MTVGELIRALWDIKNKNMEVVTKLGDRKFKVYDAYCSDEKTILFLNQKETRSQRMETFEKGDFVKVNDKEIGIVAGECGNLLKIRLNNMAEILCNPRLDGQKVEKIKGVSVPVNLDDAEVRKNLRGAWCTVKNNFGIYETPINGFGKVGTSGKWKAIFQWQISDGGWGADSDELYENVKIGDLPVRAVEER